MALDFRASQFRGAKFIASGSTGTGAKLVFYDIANDDSGSPNQGNINTATWDMSNIGDDIFLFVSGTVLSGTSEGRITAFGGSVKVSGVLTVGTGSIYLSGSTIMFTNPPYNAATAFYDPSNNGVLIANHNINDGSFMSPFGQFKPVNMTIRAASTANSGAGGSLSLTAGGGGYRYGSGDMSGGSVQISAGTGGSQAEPGQDGGNGGNISLSAGTGGSVDDLGTPGTGGNVTVTAGNGGFSLINGNGSAGGNINLTGGTGGAGQVGYSGGNGGNLNLTGGDPTAPGPNTGGNVNITAGGDLFGFVNCTPGSVNVKTGQNAISGTIGKITFYGENLPIPGTDAYFVVSGTIATGSSAKLASFESSIKVSGSLGFSNAVYMQREGNDLKFYDVINPQGYSLSQLASSSGGGGPVAGSGSLQAAYMSGATIITNDLTGSVVIGGYPGPASASLRVYNTHTGLSRGIMVMSSDNVTEMIQLNAANSAFGYANIKVRSRGGVHGFIGFSNETSNELTLGSGFTAYLGSRDDENRSIIGNKLTDGKTGIWNETTGYPVFESQNGTPGYAVFFADTPTAILNNSASLVQSGTAYFYRGLSGSLTRLHDGSSYLRAGSNVTITTNSNGSVTIAASVSGSGGSTNQRVFLAAAMTTVSTASVGAGQNSFSGVDWSSAPSQVYLRGVANVTSPPHTASFQLFNTNTQQYVDLGAGAMHVNVTASNPTNWASSDIYPSLSSSHIFELRVSSSLSSSFVSLGSAEFYVVF